MRTNRSILLSAVAAFAIAAPAAAGPGNSPHPKPGSQSDLVTVDCNTTSEPADTITLDGPTLLWPPNHKLVDISIVMTDGDDGENAPVEFVTTSSHDEIAEDGTEMNGSGNTDVDTVDADASGDMGQAEGTVQVRAERSGRGDGREYFVTVDGMAGDDECTADFTILVPHDMRPSNRVKPNNG